MVINLDPFIIDILFLLSLRRYSLTNRWLLPGPHNESFGLFKETNIIKCLHTGVHLKFT